jgi:hypothetical protein
MSIAKEMSEFLAQRNLLATASNSWHDTNGVAIFNNGVEPIEESHIVIVDVNIHEATKFAGIRNHSLSDAWASSLECIEYTL